MTYKMVNRNQTVTISVHFMKFNSSSELWSLNLLIIAGNYLINLLVILQHILLLPENQKTSVCLFFCILAEICDIFETYNSGDRVWSVQHCLMGRPFNTRVGYVFL